MSHELRPVKTPTEETKDDAYLNPTSEEVQEVPGVDPDTAASRHLFTYAEAAKMKRMVDWRLLPPLFFAYLLRSVDKTLVSYVKVINAGTHRNITAQLGMTTNDYAWAATAWAITYTIFEIPSNLTIKRATPRASHILHLARIVIIWSVVAGCTAACQNAASFLACRALLGLAEAGFYPGILYFFNMWYRPDEMAFRLLAISTLAQFANVFNTLMSYGFSFTNDRIAPWRWCYITVGVWGVVIGCWMAWVLPDYPDSPPGRRQFLTEEQGRFYAARLPPSAARSTDKNNDWPAIRRELRSKEFWAFGMSLHFLAAGTAGLTFWLPTIIKDFGLTSQTQSLLLNVPPAITYVVVQLSTGWFMDRDTRVPRGLILTGCGCALVAGYFGLIFVSGSAGRYAMILLVYVPYAIFYGMIYATRSQSLRPGTAAVSLAGLNTFACVADLYTAQIFRSQYAPRYVVPFVVCMVLVFLCAVFSAISWWLVYDNEREVRMVARRRRQIGKEQNIVATDEITTR